MPLDLALDELDNYNELLAFCDSMLCELAIDKLNELGDILSGELT